MTIASYLGISESESERLDSGQGTIYERTLIVGGSVIVLHNIGTMRLIDGKKNPAATVIGIVIALMGLMMFSSSIGAGLFIFAAGAALAIWNVLRKIETYLSLGTSDGKTTFIVSKNRQFLHEVRDFLRHKIDTKSSTGATINISNSTLEGNFAMGSGASALHQA